MAYSDQSSCLEDCRAYFANDGAIRGIIAEVTPVVVTADVGPGSLKDVSSTWQALQFGGFWRISHSVSGLGFLSLPHKGISFHQAVYCSRSPVPFITGIF